MAPATAVQVGQNGSYCYVVKNDNTVEYRPVTVSRTVGGQSVIEKGLTEGERVVTDGQLRLTNGSRIEIRTTAEPKEGGARLVSMPESCIRRPVMTTLVMMAFVIFGLFSYRLLPVAALPRVDFPTIVVSANLPGASAETMASSVATPLEKQFSTIAGVSSIVSTSGQGVTTITLQFDLNRNIDGAALDVQSAMTTAAKKLPIEMTTPPSFQKVNPADQPVLFLVLSSATQPLSTVDEYAETLIGQRVSQLSGVAQVQVFGAQKYAVRVQANPEALAAKGIGLTDLQNAIAAANSSTPVGQLSGPNQSYTIEAPTGLNEAAHYRDLVVAYRNGAPVRLREVAKVIDSVENDQIAGWLNGTRSIILAVLRQPDANTVEVVDSVKALLPIFREQIPPSVDLKVLNDRSLSIRQSVTDVRFTLALTVALVVMVIFLFLRNVTATIIPALALPVSVIGTFAGMYVMGYSIDNLSLLALTLSVGFVVDDAIVMLENIVRHIENGERPFEAALKGSREIGFTIISITLSLVAVFIPVLFMGGVVGRVFREFAVTISMTILISGLVSLTLTPMLCSRLLKPHQPNQKHNALYRATEAGFQAVIAGYAWGLRHVLAHKFITLLVTLGTLVLSMWLYVVVPKGFFPIEDTGLIFAFTEAAQDISFESMAAHQKEVAAIIKADPAVQDINSFIGATGFSPSLNLGRMFVTLKPLDERKLSVIQIIQRLRSKVASVPGMKVFFQPIQNIQLGGRLSKSLYQYTLQDGNIDELYRLAPVMQEKIGALPGFQDVTSDLQLQNRQVTSRFRSRQDGAVRPHRRPGAQFPLQLLRHAADLHDLHALERVRGDPGERPRISEGSLGPLEDLRARRRRPDGAARRLRHRPRGRRTGDGEPSGPAPLGHHLLQSGAGRLARRGGERHQPRRARGQPASGRRQQLPGHRPGIPGFPEGPGPAAVRRSDRHLHRAGNSLRELHPSRDDPLRPAGGGSRRDPDAHAVRTGSQRHRHHRHRHADRHRQEERDHDDRLRDRGAAQQ